MSKQEATYRVFRLFQRTGRKFTIIRSTTLALAQAHCSDPESSASRTRRYGLWMDCYTANK